MVFHSDTTDATHRQITTSAGAFLSPARSGGGASCTYENVLKEIVYTAIIDFDEIQSVTADVVYADLTDYPCDDTVTLMFK